MGGTRRIGISVEHENAFGRAFIAGIADFAQTREDWSLEIIEPSQTTARALSRFDGFVFRVVRPETAALLERLGRPVVDAFYKRPHPAFAAVKVDNAAIAELAARHLLDRRFSNFAFCGYDGAGFSDARGARFAELLSQAHYPCAHFRTSRRIVSWFENMVVTGERIVAAPDARPLKAWLRALPKPVAVFCCHDVRAHQVLRSCRELGIRVPAEVAILGVDNDNLVCNFATPRISSIDTDAETAGRTAAGVLHAMMTDPAVRKRPPVLFVKPKCVVERGSTDVCPLKPDWLSDALTFVRKNVGNGISATDVFGHAGLSHTVVERTFREKLGRTVQQEIAAVRMEEARHLLRHSGLQVKEVAARSGFRSPEYFSRQFVAANGLSPEAWRRSAASPVSGS